MYSVLLEFSENSNSHMNFKLKGKIKFIEVTNLRVQFSQKCKNKNHLQTKCSGARLIQSYLILLLSNRAIRVNETRQLRYAILVAT